MQMNEQQNMNQAQVMVKKTSGMAVASLILGILGLIPLCALVGLVLGIIALVQISGNAQRLKGKGMAIAGIVLSVFFMLVIPISILMPALGRARELAKQVACGAQLNGIGKAIALYQNDFGGACPPDLQTLMATEDIVPHMLICPSAEMEEPVTGVKDELAAMGQIWPLDKEESIFAYFPSGISYIYRGADLTMNDPGYMILAYDKAENHNRDVRNVLYLDCHVKKMEEEYFQEEIKKDNAFRRQLGRPEKPVD
ncbi:MAG: DUF4190 domain-containing protein [Sedimentisphaerales bacterium]|nr:DUF4190 domain-containing protein [Sedimentisphaerales bacterium]